MKRHWSLLNLDIIGFASTLEKPTLPRILAPVFRDRDEPDRVLLPPFTVIGDEVFNAVASTMAEFEDMVVAEKLTSLTETIPGQVGHDLWVDTEGEIGYDLKAQVKKAFEEIFTTHLARAGKHFAEKDYAIACQHADIARAVKPSHIDPLVIRAASESLMGLTSRLAYTRSVAAAYVSLIEFDVLVEDRTNGPSVAEIRGAAAMQGMATRKPRQLANVA